VYWCCLWPHRRARCSCHRLKCQSCIGVACGHTGELAALRAHRAHRLFINLRWLTQQPCLLSRPECRFLWLALALQGCLMQSLLIARARAHTHTHTHTHTQSSQSHRAVLTHVAGSCGWFWPCRAVCCNRCSSRWRRHDAARAFRVLWWRNNNGRHGDAGVVQVRGTSSYHLTSPYRPPLIVITRHHSWILDTTCCHP
jgi:hypothetical protein